MNILISISYLFLIYWMGWSMHHLFEMVQDWITYIHYPEIFRLIQSVPTDKIKAAQVDAWFFETHM
jgi:hypothetical protein